ncbi:MAG: 50S ribosomal protein L9 [Desulfobacterales bacterium]|jgi:large subunit ribosomal protein L9|nr:50S ribosomal protein L9 [Desulfobacter sp.]MDP6395769.1 50S ribosomal protein L9 [Desulfobacterales bacterium]MDP6681778.1 50S ribosomal protein L9 [Desulfobacterales bacterium]MDP6807513.1 50S ribosomal protein L9 [Desulfobacterales bacterium]HJO63606.1 50S ribosomal protein L9 [Desulfobacterales bacterium]|tara:strand:+ start:35745 stop:36188 length:444 start_codon:yes stop_codon:yes gene_type:complete
MKVILKETIDSLGIIGNEVTVADGYARNYLLPQNKAVLATPQNRKILEQDKKKFELQIAKEKEFAEKMAARLNGVSCKISAKVSERDRLYGSVKIHDIIKALEKQDIKVDKRMILLREPIKKTGTQKIPIRIYTDVEPVIEVEVVPE